jgi:hypothetical protein
MRYYLNIPRMEDIKALLARTGDVAGSGAPLGASGRMRGGRA